MRQVSFLALLFLLVACSDGGGGGGSSREDPDTPPDRLPRGLTVLKVLNTGDITIRSIQWRDTVREQDVAAAIQDRNPPWDDGGWDLLWNGTLEPGETADCGVVDSGFYDFRFWLYGGGSEILPAVTVSADASGACLVMTSR